MVESKNMCLFFFYRFQSHVCFLPCSYSFLSSHKNEVYCMGFLLVDQQLTYTYIHCSRIHKHGSYLIFFSSRLSFVHNTCFKIFKISIQLFCNKKQPWHLTSNLSYCPIEFLILPVLSLELFCRLVSAQTYLLPINF